MKPILLISQEGRMSKELQRVLSSQNRPFEIFSPEDSLATMREFDHCGGVIDFSHPSITQRLLIEATQVKLPFVCATTGWASAQEREAIFKKFSNQIPILWDANFSVGIEILCQLSEKLAQHLDEVFFITDIHHKHKVDAPSGTSLKLEERIREVQPHAQVEHRDFRMGEMAGEHRVSVAWGFEQIEIMHKATSREAFAVGAIQALDWLIQQKPGFYRMRDALK